MTLMDGRVARRKIGASRRTRKTRPLRLRFEGWRTTDEDEIERRRLRAATEDIRIRALEREQPFFGTFLARSPSGEAYQVEMRSLEARINSCDCPDHAINRLGTCKHVEAVLRLLRRKRGARTAAAAGSTRFEVYLDRRDARIRVVWPSRGRASPATRRLLSPFFSSHGELIADPLDGWPALVRAVVGASQRVRARIRLSRHVEPWLEDLHRQRECRRAREAFEADVAAGKQTFDVVERPLYPYQRDGMLHLAFTGRALLADEMGLGKTVQAIAACALLRQLHGIERVLVVSPASLKAEWEEQITKFTGLPSRIIQGSRAGRLRQYRETAFFYLAGYEQVRPNRRELNEVLAPDVIILDEAQRIKNWQTKTAQAVKRLRSRYAFVLTGTPLENRIDEIYSIVEFLDPHAFGPLFRFNREFYELDDRGRAVGYRNLDELHRRLRPLMLRRRKEEVEEQLPERTVNTYFVSMHPEQAVRYEEYNARVARLVSLSARRPLTREEWEQLQKLLACMRMLCDTPYILDAECRVAPKLEELQNVLAELLEEGHKVIVFSEWERMLELVAERVPEMEIEHAWHTGSTPLHVRRAEIRRFKQDPDCRVLLSTDSGALGLNLQAASVVINLDMPWNPARLEQRIARAWRKHQRRGVHVVNLVAEDTIEHRMLHLLEQKRALAAGVVDGVPGTSEMALPSGRRAFLERVRTLMTPPPGSAPGEPAPRRQRARKRVEEAPSERLREDVIGRLAGRVARLELHGGDDDTPTIVAVLDRVDDAAREVVVKAAERHLRRGAARVELMDRATYAAVQRLIESGVLRPGGVGGQILHQEHTLQASVPDPRHRWREAARRHFQEAERKSRMAEVLAAGGFGEEALVPLHDALERALQSLARLDGRSDSKPLPLEYVQATLVPMGMVPREAVDLLVRLRPNGAPPEESEAERLVEVGQRIVRQAAQSLAGNGETRGAAAGLSEHPPPVR
jgi:superfamily II DNA or RNA helicase